MAVLPKSSILDLPASIPFIGPETLERHNGRSFQLRLGANENSFLPSPKVREAITAHINDIWHYGDPENYQLRQALAKFYNINSNSISIGPGIDPLLKLIVEQYMQQGDLALNALGGYPTFNYHLRNHGARLHSIPYKDYQVDLEAFIEAAHLYQPRIIYIANPDNPLGTFHNASELRDFLHALPDNSLIILDEAYIETAPQQDVIPINEIFHNVIRLRTFSKAYALAGMRIGYAIGPANLISYFDRTREHFAVNLLAQKAALAALNDQNYLNAMINNIAAARQRLVQIATENHLHTLPSASNFVAIDCGQDAAFAENVLNHLARAGIFIRKPAAPGIDHLIRVSVAPDDALDIFAQQLPLALEKAKQQ